MEWNIHSHQNWHILRPSFGPLKTGQLSVLSSFANCPRGGAWFLGAFQRAKTRQNNATSKYPLPLANHRHACPLIVLTTSQSVEIVRIGGHDKAQPRYAPPQLLHSLALFMSSCTTDTAAPLHVQSIRVPGRNPSPETCH